MEAVKLAGEVECTPTWQKNTFGKDLKEGNIMSELMELEDIVTTLAPVENDMDAEECMAQIAGANEDKSFWKKYYEQALAKVNESCDQVIAEAEARLAQYFSTVPHKKTSTQEKYSLPSGDLIVKKVDPEYQRDDEEVIKWLKANNGQKFIKTKESLDWAGLKKTLTIVGETAADENGKALPIKVIEQPDAFKVQLKKKEA